MFELIIQLLFIAIILAITYTIGTIIEKRHYKKILQREIALIRKPIITYGAKKWNTKRKIRKIELVAGEAVISGDYFKNFVAGFKNFFGGRLTPHESILDRARREAILRMREKARKAHLIVNVKIESIMVNDQNRADSIPQCAVIAYGTAVTYEPQPKK